MAADRPVQIADWLAEGLAHPHKLAYFAPGEPPTPAFLGPLRLTRKDYPLDYAIALAGEPALAPAIRSYLSTIVDQMGWVDQVSGDYVLPILCLALLGQLRDEQSADLMVKVLALSSDDLDCILGDYLHDTMPAILAAVAAENLESIMQVIENPLGYDFARAVGIHALAILHEEKKLALDELCICICRLLDGTLERESSFVWCALAGLIADLRLNQYRDEMVQAFQEGLMDNFSQVDFDWHLDKMSQSSPGGLESVDYQCADGLLELLWDSGLLNVPVGGKLEEEDEDFPDLGGEEWPWDPPYPGNKEDREVVSKVGRNEPCPCGSGRKFKKCCGK